MEVFLYNSTVCRLCGEENDSGNLLYSSEDNNQSLCDLINTYLPIKVSDDGELPRTICPGCTIQLEATVEFLNLIINGQKVIRELHQREKEYKKSISNDNEPEVITERIVYEINTSDGVYQVEHPIALQVSGLEKPKRKRGRPPKKPKSPEEIAQELAAREKELAAKKQKAAKQVEVSGKRTRKAPTRYQEAVQGKELERIFKEEGVIDEMDGEAEIKKEAEEVEEKPPPKEPEVIGHLEDSGELVVVVKGKGRGRPKGRMRQTHEACTICGMEFNSVGRYMSHVAQHGPVMYQCTTCGLTHPTLIEHQTHQKNEGHEGQLVIPCQAQENKTTTTAEEGDVEIQVVPEQDPLNVPDLVIPEEAKSLPTLDETKEEFIKNLVSGESSSNVSDTNNDDKPSTSDNPKETTSETEVVELGPKGKPRLKCNQCDKTFNSKQSKSLHIKVHQTSKRKKLTREERLARNKLAQQKRRERIRHDPEKHEAWKAKQRERAERRKMEGKVLPMAQLPPEIQKNLRERNKRNSRKFFMKQKLLKVIKAASQEFLKHEDKNEDSYCDSEPELNEK